ncbi:hypothetical protein BH20CHL6_BH20CHL6_10530 [soil metagenome]
MPRAVPSVEAPIRVWLEPDYDYGRCGAWMLDWPGCFTWGRTREIALARVPSAVGRYAAWAATHGEAVSPPGSGHVDVVEEVAAVRADGYERNATFGTDLRTVEPAELETVIRRLGYAREDLLDVAARVDAFEAAGGRSLVPEERPDTSLAAGAASGRVADEVLRHVAGAEIWLAGRLDRTARYGGPSRDADREAFLTASRSWAIERLGELFRRDPGFRATDAHGESWTLAKVLRRLVYHSLDHLEELDRRLAVAEGRIESVILRRDVSVDLDELGRLLALAGLGGRARDPDRLRRMVHGATHTVSAWDGAHLVGFGRLISDGASNAYISTVAVHPRWQDRGVGARLVSSLIDGRDDLKFVLHARAGTEEFYARLGFGVDSQLLVRERRR